VLFEEIKSWLQNDVYDTSEWEIFDEDGKVDINPQREPRDGERYIVLSPEVSEELRGSMNARFKKFLQTTRWRRIKSRYKIELFEEQAQIRGFETVEEAIHRKHVRYSTRWKQRKRILAQPVESSPLCDDFTSPDASQLQDQIQTPAASGWKSVGSDVESHHTRGSRNCRTSLGGIEQGQSGSAEIQPSHPGFVANSGRFKRLEEVDEEPDAADAQLRIHDHDSPTPELVGPLRKDSKLDGRLQVARSGTKGYTRGMSSSDTISLGQSRADSKVAEGTWPTRLNEDVSRVDQLRPDLEGNLEQYRDSRIL
jgi:hypothetical protein